MFICYTPVVLIYTILGEIPFASEGPPTALSLARYPPSFSFLAVWGEGRKKRPHYRAQLGEALYGVGIPTHCIAPPFSAALFLMPTSQPQCQMLHSDHPHHT